LNHTLDSKYHDVNPTDIGFFPTGQILTETCRAPVKPGDQRPKIRFENIDLRENARIRMKRKWEAGL
jgi:hypothetical protein